MVELIEIGDPAIEVELRPSARAKRYALRVSALDGRVLLTLPRGGSKRAALAFAREKLPWLEQALAQQKEPVRIGYNVKLPFEGKEVEIVPGKAIRPRLVDGRLEIGGSVATLGPRLAGFLKAQARMRLSAASQHYADRIGRDFARLSLRDTRSRWGSCTSEGNLMFSWRLILAPPEVLDYVAAHEVAHLRQMNHSPAFWAEVGALMPQYQAPRRWLRVNGAGLHAYRFT